jgi:hypothetical protein
MLRIQATHEKRELIGAHPETVLSGFTGSDVNPKPSAKKYKYQPIKLTADG